MRQYLMNVICASLMTGILLSLIRGSAAQAVVKLLCGAYLAVTVISPLARIDLGRELALLLPDQKEGEQAAREGASLAREKIASFIKADLEAYILDKAEAVHGDLTVSVALSEADPPVPVGAKLNGRISPYARAQLETILEKELGIPKEKLQWSG